VRVNDRGPFHGNRLIDLSYAAAVKLGFVDDGTARVRIEVIQKNIAYYLQVGAFKDYKMAQDFKKETQVITGIPGRIISGTDDRLYRVHLGPISRYDEAARLQEILFRSKYPKPLILDY
tara:strand:+ start:1481 stop:1837 length:357 start_codon:yes stop_codon:yes gene_type:complete